MRLALARQSKELYACWVGEYDRERALKSDVVLIKLHKKNDELARKADTVITCHRDLRDVAASVVAIGWASEECQVLDHVRSCRNYHDYWSPLSDLDLRYSDIVERPRAALASVLATLRVPSDPSAIEEILGQLSATPNNRSGDSIHDHEYLTHANHRNDGTVGRWRTQLDGGLAEQITSQHSDWLIRLGYDEQNSDQSTKVLGSDKTGNKNEHSRSTLLSRLVSKFNNRSD
jgi:hypothetical protein